MLHATLGHVDQELPSQRSEEFYEAGRSRGIRADQAKRLRRILTTLDTATVINDMNLMPGWRLHPLTGDLKGFWSVSVSGNWRLIFRFNAGDATDLDLIDYH